MKAHAIPRMYSITRLSLLTMCVCVDFASPGSAGGTFCRSFKCGTSILLWASSKTQGRRYSEKSRHLSSWLAALAGIGLFSGEGTKGKHMSREQILCWQSQQTLSTPIIFLSPGMQTNSMLRLFLQTCFIIGFQFFDNLVPTNYSIDCTVYKWRLRMKCTNVDAVKSCMSLKWCSHPGHHWTASSFHVEFASQLHLTRDHRISNSKFLFILYV